MWISYRKSTVLVVRAVGTGALHQRGDDKGGEVNRVKGYLKDKCQQLSG